MDDLDRSNVVRRYAGSLADRVEFVPEAQLSVIEEINLGILFVMAFWSVPCVKAFFHLVHVVARLDPDARLRFVVVDTDEISQLHEVPPFRGNLHGWGETFWIRDGKIVLTSGHGLNIECLEPNTVRLIGDTR